MGTTIVGPASVRLTRARAPVIQTKETWDGTWRYRPKLELVEAMEVAGGQDLGRCVVKRKYGSIKQPYQSSSSTVRDIKLDKHWLRVRVTAGTGARTIWIGQVSGEDHKIYGSDVARSGVQGWVAYSPLQVLRKKPVSRSYWDKDGTKTDIGWVPNMNMRGEHNTLFGNRSSDKIGEEGTYLYGGDEVWNHGQAAEYILKHFADSDNGPTWQLAGQAELLKDIEHVISFRATQYVSDVLAYLISPRMGIDYKIVESDNGFAIHVFALSAREVTFEGAKLPTNPDKVRIQSSETQNMPNAEVVRSDDQRFDRIRVFGRRMVLCCSLKGDKVPETDNSLKPKWDFDTEREYMDGTGIPADYAEEHDQARMAEKFQAIYQSFGAPDDWGKAAPTLDAAGEVTEGEQDYQVKTRETLRYLPLWENWDYSVDPPIDMAPEIKQRDLMQPLVLLSDNKARDYILEGTWWVRAENESISVFGALEDWGIMLRPHINHLIALNNFDDIVVPPADTVYWPKFEYEEMIATIALRADQRLMLTYGDEEADAESTKDIFISGAELWLLMPKTVVAVDAIGKIMESPNEIVVLRNDAQYLRFIMAGAIARYAHPRARASVTLKGLQSWGGLLGQILTMVEEAGGTESIQAPITSVSWFGGESPMTIIDAGHAR